MIKTKTIVINLEKRKDKRIKMIQRLESFGFTNYEIFNAVDGENILTENIPIALRNHFSKGVYGCALSHLFAVTQAFNKDKELQNLIVLEDDVLFTEDIRYIDDIISSTTSLYKENTSNNNTYKNIYPFDFMYLGFIPIRDIYKYEQLNPLFKFDKQLTEINRVLNGANGLFAYVINRKFLNKFIDAINEFKMPCDNAIMKLQKDNDIFTINPFIAIQEEGYSDTSNRNVKFDFSEFMSESEYK